MIIERSPGGSAGTASGLRTPRQPRQIGRMTINVPYHFDLSRSFSSIAALCLTLGCHSSSGAAGARVSGAQPLGRPTGTLVVSNMRDNTAMLLDASTGTPFVTLPTGEGPHEVAVSHDGRWALVSNYGVRERPGNSITVIDVVRRAVARTLDLGEVRRPHGMSFLPGDTLFAVTSEVSRAVLLIDFASGRVVRSLPSN